MPRSETYPGILDLESPPRPGPGFANAAAAAAGGLLMCGSIRAHWLEEVFLGSVGRYLGPGLGTGSALPTEIPSSGAEQGRTGWSRVCGASGQGGVVISPERRNIHPFNQLIFSKGNRGSVTDWPNVSAHVIHLTCPYLCPRGEGRRLGEQVLKRYVRRPVKSRRVAR